MFTPLLLGSASAAVTALASMSKAAAEGAGGGEGAPMQMQSKKRKPADDTGGISAAPVVVKRGREGNVAACAFEIPTTADAFSQRLRSVEIKSNIRSAMQELPPAFTNRLLTSTPVMGGNVCVVAGAGGDQPCFELSQGGYLLGVLTGYTSSTGFFTWNQPFYSLAGWRKWKAQAGSICW